MRLTPISLSEPPRPPRNWRLDRTPPAAAEPKLLDEYQQQVVDHREGALLVLAGPGTGKTTTLTEAVVARLSGERPLAPEQVLVLTFGRKAAAEIRDRVIARLGGGVVPTVCTFHSLALSIVKEFDVDPEQEGQVPVNLLTGAEQELALRTLLNELAAPNGDFAPVEWPEELRPALGTRGMAVEVRNAIAKARSLNFGPEQLAAAAKTRPEWAAVADVLRRYLDLLDDQRSIDYGELIARAVALAAVPANQAALRARYRCIFVDEYQDTDPLQVELLRLLRDSSTEIVAVGDPDQSIYAFRGADDSAVKRFYDDFAAPGESREPVNLRRTRRFGTGIHVPAKLVIEADRLVRPHRDLQCPDDSGQVSITHYDDADVEAESVADSIRRLVLSSNGARKWSDVAVLVRSGVRSIPTLERALTQAGVPVVSTYDDLPLGQEPAVATLLLALECAVDLDRLRNPVHAKALLTSPIGGADIGDLRRLARLVRDAQDEPGASEVWLAAALADVQVGLAVDAQKGGDAWRRLIALRDLLGRVRTRAEKGATVHELLWLIWDGTEWRKRLRSRALGDGMTAIRANRDLDAVITLFNTARAEAGTGGGARARIDNFCRLVRDMAVAANPLDPVLVPNAVNLMTAHRAKGLEWEVVYICSADENTWPDVRRRASVLTPERLYAVETSAGKQAELGEQQAREELVDEERRLFYVAMTRAKSELHISTTAADKESGRLPSRFLAPIDGIVATRNALPRDRRERALGETARYSPSALAAQLRLRATAATGSERVAIAAKLARLARLSDEEGRQLVPAADPRSWWGVADATENEHPIDRPDEPLYLRGSSLEKLEECSLRWLLQQRLEADTPGSSAMFFGNVVHALASGIIRENLAPKDPRIQELLNLAWQRIRFDAPWVAASELAEARVCLDRFADWLATRNATAMMSEVPFSDVVTLRGPGGQVEQFKLHGTIDIIEIEADGHVYVGDLKTGKSSKSDEEAEDDWQLGLYQLAVSGGHVAAFNEANPQLQAPIEMSGAQLLYPRKALSKGQPGMGQATQKAHTVGGEEDVVFRERLFQLTELVRAEAFAPTLGHCETCPYKSLCPMKIEGREVFR